MKRIAVCGLLMLGVSCASVNEDSETGPDVSDGLALITVSASLNGELMATRSILGDSSIENRITDVTLASYSAEGKLLDARHYSAGMPVMELWVDARGGNTVYSLVNMGDMTERFPTDEDDVEKIEYVLESLEGVAESGMPMCGMRRNVSSEELPVIVDVERLFAKVRVRVLHTMLSGAGPNPYAYNLCNKSIYMRQANSILSPFRAEGSRAARKPDVMNLSDYHADMNDRNSYEGSLSISQLGPGPGYFQDTTFVFYLPENNQGVLLPDNTSPAEKVYENISLLDGVPYGDLCTYVEFNARRENTGNGYYGDLTYRFYLGCDSTSDFSLKRNSVYDLTLNLSERHMLSDGWEVTRGSNWTDTRTLKFLEGPYIIYQGQSENVMIHYHKFASGLSSSQLLPEDWSLGIDRSLVDDVGLSYEFDPAQLVKGENGMSDFCVEFKASKDAEVGAVIPLKITSWDGGLNDYATLTVARLGEMTLGWDSAPRYVSQYGNVTVCGVPAAKRPVSMSCDDDAKVDFQRLNDTTFRVVAKAAGTVELSFSNSDGTQTTRTVLDIMPPRLKVAEGVISLNPDGEPVRLSYSYLDNQGEILRNVDKDVYEEVLYPVASGSGFIIFETSDTYMDMAIGRLYCEGEPIGQGVMYNVDISARGCDAVSPSSRIFRVEEPFAGIGVADYGRLDDFTLFSLPDVNQNVAAAFSGSFWADEDKIITAPVPVASPSCIAAELRPLWTDGYSSGNGIFMLDYVLEAGRRCWRVRMTRPDAHTYHSAGLHELVLLVRNRHSSETLEHVCGTMEVYLHTMLGARASFGYGRGDAVAADGRTMAQVYNSLAGRNVYGPDSYMYYMDVSIDYLTPVAGAGLLPVLKSSAASNNDAFDLIRPSKSDGYVDPSTDLLYSVQEYDPIRISLGEPYGIRTGIGKTLYRAFKMKNYTSLQPEAGLYLDFLGYTGAACPSFYRPMYSVYGSGTESGRILYFSPSSYPSCRDSEGKGYYVIHFLEDTAPLTLGWADVLQ